MQLFLRQSLVKSRSRGHKVKLALIKMISGLVCILFLSLKLAFNLDGRNQLEHGVKQEHIFCDKLSGTKTDRPFLLL